MKTLTTAYAFGFMSLDNQTISLADYRGKVLLIVNTASKCGLAKQYEVLQTLQAQYQDQGLVVIGVASQDFGKQEYTDSCQIKTAAQQKFSLTFPLTALTKVKGDEAHPFYKWARNKVGFMGTPKWNFHKYLIGRDGQIIDWYSSVTSPLAPQVTKAIEEGLKE